ncbi:MAG: alpha/beta hydrolase [Patescibacteria group bacterium]|nr:alpha/beta hydrolase [Patescibacteria group bacterium]
MHGAGNDSSGNWFPWLKKELEKKGYLVWVPDLPNPDEPTQDEWLKTIFSHGWQFDSGSVLIGHSIGATLILRILEKLPEEIKIDKAILVAGTLDIGTNSAHFIYKRGLVKEPFSWGKIKKSAKEFYFIHSDNDPYECDFKHGEVMQKKLGGELIIKKGEGHFNLEKESEYKQFPFLLELLEAFG